MSVVDEVFFLILDLLNNSMKLVMPVVLSLFSLTLGSALIRLTVGWLAGAMENMIGDLMALLVVFMIFFAFAAAAKEITDGAGKFALGLGSSIVGAGAMSQDDFGPSALWGIGEGQASQILETKRALCTSTWECLKTMGDQLLLEFAALCIYGAFAFLIFEMAMTILGYKLSALFMLIFTPAAVLPFTKSFSEGSIQGVVNHLVKMTIIAMVAGIASQAFDLMDLPAKPVFDDIIPALLLAFFVAFLAWQSRVLASGVISAVPQLSGQAITRGVGNVMRSAATGAGTATSAMIMGNREKASISAAVSEIASGAQRAPARIANAAAAVQNGGAAAKGYLQKVRAANGNAGAAGKTAGAAKGGGGGTGGQSAGNASGGFASGAQANSGGSAGNGGGGAPPRPFRAAQTPPPPPKAASPAKTPTTSPPPAGPANDGRFQVPEPRLHAIGLGGGYRGTGWRNQSRPSIRNHASKSLSGYKAANAERMAVAVTRQVHFGQPPKRF